MSERNSKKDNQRIRQEQTKKGNGQQTGGNRGQKLDKENREGYRSSEQKRQSGNHGGNR